MKKCHIQTNVRSGKSAIPFDIGEKCIQVADVVHIGSGELSAMSGG